MHEQSLVRSLLKQVESLRLEHDGDCVTEVRVEIGPISGVESLLLSSAFELLTMGTTAENATLIIDEIPLMAKCTSCNHNFEIGNFVFRCPQCSGNVKVTSGDEFHLTSVTFSDMAFKNDPVSEAQTSENQSTQRMEGIG